MSMSPPPSPYQENHKSQRHKEQKQHHSKDSSSHSTKTARSFNKTAAATQHSDNSSSHLSSLSSISSSSRSSSSNNSYINSIGGSKQKNNRAENLKLLQKDLFQLNTAITGGSSTKKTLKETEKQICNQEGKKTELEINKETGVEINKRGTTTTRDNNKETKTKKDCKMLNEGGNDDGGRETGGFGSKGTSHKVNNNNKEYRLQVSYATKKEILLVSEFVLVSELRRILSGIFKIPLEEIVLTYKNRVLNRECTLGELFIKNAEYNCEQSKGSGSFSNNTTKLARQPECVDRVNPCTWNLSIKRDYSKQKSNLPTTNLKNNKPSNDDPLQSLMNNPMVKSILRNPEATKSIKNFLPEDMLEQNDALDSLMNSGQLEAELINMAESSNYLNAQLRNADVAMAKLENIPGGINMMNQYMKGFSSSSSVLNMLGSAKKSIQVGSKATQKAIQEEDERKDTFGGNNNLNDNGNSLIKYVSENATLMEAGFLNVKDNYDALSIADGDLEGALEILIAKRSSQSFEQSQNDQNRNE